MAEYTISDLTVDILFGSTTPYSTIWEIVRYTNICIKHDYEFIVPRTGCGCIKLVYSDTDTVIYKYLESLPSDIIHQYAAHKHIEIPGIDGKYHIYFSSEHSGPTIDIREVIRAGQDYPAMNIKGELRRIDEACNSKQRPKRIDSSLFRY
jgi:hypothetical protein